MENMNANRIETVANSTWVSEDVQGNPMNFMVLVEGALKCDHGCKSYRDNSYLIMSKLSYPGFLCAFYRTSRGSSWVLIAFHNHRSIAIDTWNPNRCHLLMVLLCVAYSWPLSIVTGSGQLAVLKGLKHDSASSSPSSRRGKQQAEMLGKQLF